MNLLIKALNIAFRVTPKSEITQIATGNPNALGVDEINIGDKFYGYACGCFFDNQICTGITFDGVIMGTTTLAVFDKKYIQILK